MKLIDGKLSGKKVFSICLELELFIISFLEVFFAAKVKKHECMDRGGASMQSMNNTPQKQATSRSV